MFINSGMFQLPCYCCHCRCLHGALWSSSEQDWTSWEEAARERTNWVHGSIESISRNWHQECHGIVTLQLCEYFKWSCCSKSGGTLTSGELTWMLLRGKWRKQRLLRKYKLYVFCACGYCGHVIPSCDPPCDPQAEAELRMIQHSFDEQLEQTRSVLKKIVETHVSWYCIMWSNSDSCDPTVDNIQLLYSTVNTPCKDTLNKFRTSENIKGINVDEFFGELLKFPPLWMEFQ